MGKDDVNLRRSRLKQMRTSGTTTTTRVRWKRKGNTPCHGVCGSPPRPRPRSFEGQAFIGFLPCRVGLHGNGNGNGNGTRWGRSSASASASEVGEARTEVEDKIYTAFIPLVGFEGLSLA